MHRTFTTSTMRRQSPLDGAWDFAADPDDVGANQGWFNAFPSHSVAMYVPGVWNTYHAYRNYEGVGWFRCRLILRECAAAVVHFGAVTHQANVWLDGELLGEHYGGFLPFSFVVTQPEAGPHELVVRVDNTHDMVRTIPSARLDWFRYGGITRPVWIEELNGPGYIASLRLAPSMVQDAPSLQVRAELCNLTDIASEQTWTLYFGDEPLRSGTMHLEPSDAQVLSFTAHPAGVRLWSPRYPHLYSVRLVFGGDDLIERTGFRELTVVGQHVLLNGEPLRIFGINRHEDHPEWGFALPQHLMLRDMEAIASLGVDSIRGAHYPNDPRWLDLCDERGILFLEEIPLWGYAREQLDLDIIAGRASAMVWAMIDRDVSHPCVWAWSVLNECATDSLEGRAVVERLVEIAREADPTRPVTYASDRGEQDICFDLVDVVCVNAYHGWYTRDQTWPEYLDRVRAVAGDKPVVIAEFGAGALYGYRTLDEDVMWSEEYQRDLLSRCVKLFAARGDLTGFYIWQFCDVRTDGGTRALSRPRSYNNKGILDEYRRPKLAYYAVRDLCARARSR